MEVLLTGATGFVGSALLGKLLAAGHNLTIVCRSKDKVLQLPVMQQPDNDPAENSFVHRVQIIEADLTHLEQDQREEIFQGLKQCDVVIHLAGLAHSKADKEAYWQLNYQVSKNLIHLSKRAGIERFIYISSVKAAIQHNSTPYSDSKLAAEEYLYQQTRDGQQITQGQPGMQGVSLRPCAIYGPGMKGNLAGWIHKTARNLMPGLPRTNTCINMIGVEDVCDAICLALVQEHFKQSNYIISDNVPYRINDLEKAIRRGALGKTGPVLAWPKWVFYLVARASDLLKKVLGLDTGFGKNAYNTLFVDSYVQAKAFSEETGFTPKQNFFAMLPELIASESKPKKNNRKAAAKVKA